MKKIVFIMMMTLSPALSYANQETEFDKAFKAVCPNCFKIINHLDLMSGFSLSTEDKIDIANTSANYAFRMALVTVNEPMYNTLEYYEQSTGSLLSVSEAQSYIKTDSFSELMQYVMEVANEGQHQNDQKQR